MHSQQLTTAIDAARVGGEVLRKLFRSKLSVAYKDANNLVTEADEQSERIILEIVRTAFPDHAIFSEEAGMQATQSDYLWVIDPLDGTSNFSRGIPHFGISIALLYQARPIVGVLYAPAGDELFAAEHGQGATLNGMPIHISSAPAEKTIAVVSRGTAPAEKRRHAELMNTLIGSVRTIRIPGAAAVDLAYTASGRFDVFIANGMKYYDIAAGSVIVREAGATLVDFQGNPWQSAVGKLSDLIAVAPDDVERYTSILSTY